MLTVESLSFCYPDGHQALWDISLRVLPGTKLFFHGPNGAGKTTLFQCINGLLKPQSGKVIINGKEISRSKDRIRHIGIVFQNPDDQLIAGSVYDEVAFGPLHMGVSREEVRRRVDWAMEAMGIADLQSKPPHFLSFGQKRRVTIAAVLSMGQSLLLLDEPTAGLDARQTEELTGILDNLAKEGKTLLISTHDADFSLRCADSIAVMHQGKLLVQGSPEEIFTDSPVLQQAGLVPPAALCIARALRKKGILSPDFSPRSVPELLTYILRL